MHSTHLIKNRNDDNTDFVFSPYAKPQLPESALPIKELSIWEKHLYPNFKSNIFNYWSCYRAYRQIYTVLFLVRYISSMMMILTQNLKFWRCNNPLLEGVRYILVNSMRNNGSYIGRYILLARTYFYFYF